MEEKERAKIVAASYAVIKIGLLTMFVGGGDLRQGFLLLSTLADDRDESREFRLVAPGGAGVSLRT